MVSLWLFKKFPYFFRVFSVATHVSVSHSLFFLFCKSYIFYIQEKELISHDLSRDDNRRVGDGRRKKIQCFLGKEEVWMDLLPAVSESACLVSEDRSRLCRRVSPAVMIRSSSQDSEVSTVVEEHRWRLGGRVWVPFGRVSSLLWR